MKRIFLLSTMVISSFGMMNLQTVSAAPQQVSTNTSPQALAKALVSKINQVVSLRGDQFSKVNEACVEYFQKAAVKGADIAALKSARNAKIKAALAPDQIAAWTAFKE